MKLNDMTVGLVAALFAVGVAATIDEAQAQSQAQNTQTSQTAQKRKPHASDVSNPSTVWGTGGSGPADVNQNGREDIEDYAHAGDVTVQQSKDRANEGAQRAKSGAKGAKRGWEEGTGGSGKPDGGTKWQDDTPLNDQGTGGSGTTSQDSWMDTSSQDTNWQSPPASDDHGTGGSGKHDAGTPHHGSYETGKSIGQTTRQGAETTKEMGRDVGTGVREGANGFKAGYQGAVEPPPDDHEDAHDVGAAMGRGAARVRDETRKAADKIEGAVRDADRGFREGYGGSGKADGGTKRDGGTK